MMTTDTKEHIKLLKVHANRNIGDVFDKLGISYSQRGPLMQAKCPCEHHAGDGNNDTAFSWRSDYGRWVCFTHHCERAFGNDIFGLLRSVLDVGFAGARKWLEEALADVDTAGPILETEVNARRPRLHIHEPITEDRLKFLDPDHSYLESRGFGSEVLDKHYVGVWKRIGTYMNNRVVFPVRDHQGFVVGFTGRTLLTPDEMQEQELKTGRPVAKWIHGRDYVKFPDKSKQELFITSLLFNWYNAKKHLGADKELVMVEGPLDGFRLEEAGIMNWVATLGTTFTPVQRGLLVDAGVNKIRSAYDPDIAGDGGYDKIKNIIGNLIELERVKLPRGMDPGSMTVEQIHSAFA
jgi:hypothetical protein